MSGMKSLARSSDAILTYSEESGSPVFSISSSLILTNIAVNSGATGKVGKLPPENNYFRCEASLALS